MSLIFSTAYWPPVQFFAHAAESCVLCLEQHEHYRKQSYRNRCMIYAANGPTPLIIPIVKHSGEKMPIRDVRIDYSTPWQRVHWKAIVSSYRSSPFFDYYEDDFRPFYEREELFLFDLNEKIIRLILELAGLKTDIRYTENFTPLCEPMPFSGSGDPRYLIDPKLGFTADPQFKPRNYYQVFSSGKGFAANLSMLDLLCNEGNNSLQVLRSSLDPARS